MKSVSTIMFLFLLGVMASCGKDNKSGKNPNNYFGFNQLGTSGYYNGTAIAYNGLSLQQVIMESPCAGGYQQRYQVTSAAPVNTVIPNGDVYVGVTSYGDVAAIGGTPQGPVFEAYLCPRNGVMQQGQVTPSGIQLFPYTNCGFKQMNARIPAPDGTWINFRMMDYGSSTGAKFSYCR